MRGWRLSFSIVLKSRHLCLIRARGELVMNCRKFELQFTAKNRYNSHPIFLNHPLTRFTMTLGTKMEKYHGVQCRSCGETIAVPSRFASRGVSSEPGGSVVG